MSTTTTPVEAPIWLSQFYAKVDKLDTEGVAAAFSTDASMRYGSNEAAVGPDAIRGGLTYLFTHYAGIQHEFLSVWDAGSTLMVEANVTYRTQDQREVTVPALTVIEHRDGGVIDGMRIFIDPSPAEADRSMVHTDIAVIGAGIGGLTLGLALRKHGIDVQIFEQAPELAEVGAAVALAANGTRILQDLGLGTELAAVSVVPSELVYRGWSDASGWSPTRSATGTNGSSGHRSGASTGPTCSVGSPRPGAPRTCTWASPWSPCKATSEPS